MPDITLGLSITRTLLALSPLELNDHTNYYLAPSSPAAVTWQRQMVSSPWVDDDIVINRRRGKVTEEILLEVRGGLTPTQVTLQTNLAAAIAAFSQDTYVLTTTFDGTAYAWNCDAADYQVVWDGPRVISRAVQLRLSVPRSPIPAQGPI